MTVAALTPSIEYLENGVTLAFAVPFRFDPAGGLAVRRIAADGTVSTIAYGPGWSATGGATDAGGTLNLVSSTAGATLVIERSTVRAQQVDYATNDTFPAATHEAALDRAMLIDQEQDVKIDRLGMRALMVPDGETAPPFPAIASLLGKLIGIDVDGNFFGSNGAGADAALRADLASSAVGAALVAYKMAEAGALGRSVTSRLRELPVSPLDFGAVGDGVTNDYAALLAALQSGRMVDLGARTYAIGSMLQPAAGTFKGLRNGKIVWTTIAAMKAQQSMVRLIDQSHCVVEDLWLDMGNQPDTGSVDDSSKTGLAINTSTPNTTFNEGVRIQRVRVTGDGNGTRISMRSCKRSFLVNCYVADGRAAAAGGTEPANDTINGIELVQLANCVIAGNVVNNLTTPVGGIYTARHTRGIVSFELRDVTIHGCAVANVDQGFDFSGGIAAETPEGSHSVTVSACTAVNTILFGFKFANVNRDFMVTGCVSRYFGFAGFVVSPPAVGSAYSTQCIDIVGCKALDPTGAYTPDCVGFYIMYNPADPGKPNGVRFIDCAARDSTGGGKLKTGFANGIAAPTGNLYNQIINCSSIGHTTFFQEGFHFPDCVARGAAGTLNLVNDTFTYVPFAGSDLYDTVDMHDPAVNNTRITIKKPGLYRLLGRATFVSNASNFRQANLRKNSATDLAYQIVAAVNGSVTTVMVEHVVQLAAGDWIELMVRQVSGAALDLQLPDCTLAVTFLHD